MAATAAELAFLLGEGSASISPEGATSVVETLVAGGTIAAGAGSYVYSNIRHAMGGEGRKVMKMTPSKTHRPGTPGGRAHGLHWLTPFINSQDYGKKKRRTFRGRFRKYR